MPRRRTAFAGVEPKMPMPAVVREHYGWLPIELAHRTVGVAAVVIPSPSESDFDLLEEHWMLLDTALGWVKIEKIEKWIWGSWAMLLLQAHCKSLLARSGLHCRPEV